MPTREQDWAEAAAWGTACVWIFAVAPMVFFMLDLSTRLERITAASEHPGLPSTRAVGSQGEAELATLRQRLRLEAEAAEAAAAEAALRRAAEAAEALHRKRRARLEVREVRALDVYAAAEAEGEWDGGARSLPWRQGGPTLQPRRAWLGERLGVGSCRQAGHLRHTARLLSFTPPLPPLPGTCCRGPAESALGTGPVAGGR